MDFGFPLISAVMIGTALCTFMLAAYAFSRRGVSSTGLPFSLLMAAIGEWALTAAVEASASDPAVKIMAAKVQYIGIVSTPVLWFLAAKVFSHSMRWMTRRMLAFLWLFPAVTVLLAATNEWHRLIWSFIEIGPAVSPMISRGPNLIYHHGPWFWLLIMFSYLLIGAATFLMVRNALRSDNIYRSQAAVLIAGAGMPWLGNVIYIAGLSPVPGLDLTPIAFAIAGLAAAWGVFRYRFLEIVPVACDVLVKSMDDGVVVLDAKGRVAEINPSACRIFGADGAAATGKDINSLLASLPGQDPRLVIEDRRVMHAEILAAGDEGRTFDMQSSPLFDGRKRYVGRLIVFHDVTDRKRIEEEIRSMNQTLEERVRMRTEMLEREIAHHGRAREALVKSEEKYRFMVENITDVIFVLDANGHVAYMSPAIERMTGYTPEEVIGKHFSAFVHPDEVQFLAAVLEKALSGDHAPIEFRGIDKGGRMIYVRVSGRLIRENGRIAGLSGTLSDMTDRHHMDEERHRIEAQMQHTQKLESLGVLAGGIAHDFNNILTGILGNAELAVMKLAPDSPVWDNLREIQRASFAAAELCRQMLAYSGKGRFELRRIALRDMITDISHLLEVSISKSITMRFEFPEKISYVNADPAQVRQIVMNLIINASEAIGDRPGVIMISTGSCACSGGYLASCYLGESLPEGEYSFLEVRDTGSGMDEETRSRIFEPFFTTKFTGRGLGLAAVLGIVRGHRGAIDIASEPGKGTSFKVLFPVAGPAPETAAVQPAPAGTWHGAGTLMLVDDEESVLSVGRKMLEGLGFSVITASNGREAVDKFQNSGEPISAVILDLTMPHMDGVETFRQLKRISPGTRVIISSGYSEHEITERFAGHDVSGFVQKPYRMEDLASKLREYVG